MRTAVFEPVFAVGLAIAFACGFVSALALVSRPWLGRRATDAPLREVIRRNPYEASFLLLWRQWRWARIGLVAGALLMIVGVMGLGGWPE